MTPSQHLPASLTPLDAALAPLLTDLMPVAPVELAPADALGCVAADMPSLAAHPPHDIATSDGFAVRARDLVGASSYSPSPLTSLPAWVEAGDAIPDGCDCVVDADQVDITGPIAQVLAEAIPGQGVRRVGSDIAEGDAVIASGYRLRPLDLLIARTSGREKASVRRPRLSIVNIPGGNVTANLIAENAREAGAEVVVAKANARDAASIAKTLDTSACDLLVTIGGSGVGRSDATVVALAECGEVIAHGIALQPGRTTAVGRIGRVPVIALPGASDQALAAWWTLALPVLDRLTARQKRQAVGLALARKIASSVGIAEIVLLERNEDAWMPLAVGEFSLQAIARADAWLAVGGGSEGFAAGMPADAYMLRE